MGNGESKMQLLTKRMDDFKYTERQKKLITSSERHLLKSRAPKWIITGHSLATYTHTPYQAHLKIQTFGWVKKE